MIGREPASTRPIREGGRPHRGLARLQSALVTIHDRERSTLSSPAFITE